jgi:hypothetical protein
LCIPDATEYSACTPKATRLLSVLQAGHVARGWAGLATVLTCYRHCYALLLAAMTRRPKED